MMSYMVTKEISRASNRPIIIKKKSMSPINIGLLLGLWEETNISEKARRIDKASALFFWGVSDGC